MPRFYECFKFDEGLECYNIHAFLCFCRYNLEKAYEKAENCLLHNFSQICEQSDFVEVSKVCTYNICEQLSLVYRNYIYPKIHLPNRYSKVHNPYIKLPDYPEIHFPYTILTFIFGPNWQFPMYKINSYPKF